MSLPENSDICQFQPRACSARKIDRFGVNFDAVILTESDLVQPGEEIFGRVEINVGAPIKCREMRIQYEVFLTLPSAQKNVGSVAGIRQSILGKDLPGPGGYQNSPVMCVILENVPESSEEFHTISGGDDIPFTLEVPGNICLPKPFDVKGYSLVHRLALYVKSVQGSYVEVAEKLMDSNGYINLFYDVVPDKPILGKAHYGSLFSGTLLTKATLYLDSSRFIQGEVIPFVLNVRTKKMVGMELSVCGTVWDDNLFPYALLTQFQPKKISVAPEQLKGGSYTWTDEWEIPADMPPSFHSHPMLEIRHSMHFHVEFNNYFGSAMGGDVPIFVGTTRDIPALDARNIRSNYFDVAAAMYGRQESGPSNLARHRASTGSILSLPPAYSLLSSRAQSLETLPPEYQELCPENSQEEMAKSSSVLAGGDIQVLQQD